MTELTRFGISMEAGLLNQFDKHTAGKGYKNRSEAVRDLIRNALIEEKWSENEQVVGTVTIVYNHKVRELAEKLTHQQHSHHQEVISTLHIHLDNDFCLEVIVVRGKAKEVQHIADELIGTKGVVHGKLVCTTAGIG